MAITKQPRTTYFYQITCEDCAAVGTQGESVSVNGAVRSAMMKGSFVADLDETGSVIWVCPGCWKERLKRS